MGAKIVRVICLSDMRGTWGGFTDISESLQTTSSKMPKKHAFRLYDCCHGLLLIWLLVINLHNDRLKIVIKVPLELRLII